jgi:hypothetical protein
VAAGAEAGRGADTKDDQEEKGECSINE